MVSSEIVVGTGFTIVVFADPDTELVVSTVNDLGTSIRLKLSSKTFVFCS